MDDDSDGDQLLCRFRDLKRVSQSMNSRGFNKNESQNKSQVSLKNCEQDEGDDKPLALAFSFSAKRPSNEARMDTTANKCSERLSNVPGARCKEENLKVYNKRKKNLENPHRIECTIERITGDDSQCGVSHANISRDQHEKLSDDVDDMHTSNIERKKHPSNAECNGFTKQSKMNVILSSTGRFKNQEIATVKPGRLMEHYAEVERKNAAVKLENDKEKNTKDDSENEVEGRLNGDINILENDNNGKSIQDEHGIDSENQPRDRKMNGKDIGILDDPNTLAIAKMEDEDDIPLEKMFYTESRKGCSTKRKLVNSVKEEIDEKVGREKGATDVDNDSDEVDDGASLSKMLYSSKKKNVKNDIGTKLTRRTEKDCKKKDDEEDYDTPLIRKIPSMKISSTKTGFPSKRMIAATVKSKILTKRRNLDKRDEVLDEEDENFDTEEDDDEDYDLVKTTLSRKRNSAAKRKRNVSMKNRRHEISSKMRNESDDDGIDDESDDDESYNDEDDGLSLKKSQKLSRSRISSRKSSNLQLKKKLKKMKDASEPGEGQKWTSLEHNGVIFPPPYKPHGVKMFYNGKTVDLTPEQEEVATMFAVMRDTDYATKPKFVENFWNDWKKLLGPNHAIKELESCDFTPIYDWRISEKEKKKQMSSQEKKAAKEEKMKLEEKYMWALVDGIREKVGNFRVEPPGLFRGRGEHPKMGKVKRRIYPEDIVINIGAGAPIPECPIPGRQWKEIRHDNTVTWLAYWNDPINSKEQKYVFLAASSSLKGQSDKEKYERARVLKDYVDDIRKTYSANFTSSDLTTRQIAVATYLIDRFALRAGNEKDDDEADTVGCCSLKVEHVTLVPPTSLEFDFLGKDSIRYYNKVEVIEPVYEAVGDFKKNKNSGQDLFDKLDTYKLNAHLKNIMPQLTAKVFRTYNASITLDTLLVDTEGRLIPEKIAAYQKANKEVAILCNHQKSVSKTHGAQMGKLEEKLTELTELLDELEEELESAQKGKSLKKGSEGNCKRSQNPERLERKILQTKNKIEKMKLDMTIKEDLKTVALGTSRINYMDPRITVAWCKLHEVPIEKIFNKSLLAKFAWAMDVDMSFRF